MSNERATLSLSVVPSIGFGCMNLSHAYGEPTSRENAERVLLKAIDLGIRHFDTAALYGFGKNEELLGSVLSPYRNDIYLASKCGIGRADGVRAIDGSPAAIFKTCDESLRLLRTDTIDLYYLHRWDKKTPIEDSVDAMKQLIDAGKIRAIGLSEVSATTLRKAHAVHPVAAVQSEYSLWTRNAEVAVLDACEELGVTFVAFSPLARGFLTDVDLEPDSFADKDIRRGMPRFQEPDFSRNAGLLDGYRKLARERGCSAAQLALAWILNRRPGLHVIPGTTKIGHLEENFAARDIVLSPEMMQELDTLINPFTVSGARYNEKNQAEIDTEEIDIAACR